MRSKIAVIVMTLTVVALLVGCSSAAMIRTEPPGANIYVDDTPIGKSPISYSFSTTGLRYSYKIRAELEGFYPEEQVTQSHTNFWGSVSWPDIFLRLRKIEK